MKKRRTIISFLIIIIIIFSAFFIGYRKGQIKDEPAITSSLIENRLNSVKDLVTTEYHYKNMGVYDNHNTFYGWKVPFTEKKFILSYEGTIKLGIDLKNLEVHVRGKDITIEIPSSKIISHEIDESSIKVYNEKTSVFNPIVIEDYRDFAKSQKQKTEKESIDKGLIERANTNSLKNVREIFSIDPLFNDYNIKIGIKK